MSGINTPPVQQQAPQQGDPNGAPYTPPVQQQAQPVVVNGQQFNYNAQGHLVPVGTPANTPLPQAPAAPVPMQGLDTPAPTDTVEVSTEVRTQVEGFLTTAKVSVDQVEQEIAVLGKVSDGTRKALVEKHGEATANLVLNQIDGLAAESKKQAAALQQLQLDTVAEAFKGVTEQSPQESWNELVGWARTNIDKDTRAQLNAMLKQGSFQAKQAINYMINELRSKTGTEQQGQFVGGEAAGGTDTSNLITASEYTRQLEVLVQKHGYNSPQVQALGAKREASRKRGY